MFRLSFYLMERAASHAGSWYSDNGKGYYYFFLFKTHSRLVFQHPNFARRLSLGWTPLRKSRRLPRLSLHHMLASATRDQLRPMPTNKSTQTRCTMRRQKAICVCLCDRDFLCQKTSLSLGPVASRSLGYVCPYQVQ